MAHMVCVKHKKRSNVINGKISHKDCTPCDAKEGKVFKSLAIGGKYFSLAEVIERHGPS